MSFLKNRRERKAAKLILSGEWTAPKATDWYQLLGWPLNLIPCLVLCHDYKDHWWHYSLSTGDRSIFHMRGCSRCKKSFLVKEGHLPEWIDAELCGSTSHKNGCCSATLYS